MNSHSPRSRKPSISRTASARFFTPVEVNRLEPEIRALLPRLKPAVTILGPGLADHEVVHCFVDARDTVPSSRVLVAIDGTDLEFARDLMAIGVPFLAVVPNSLTALLAEAVMVENAANHAYEADVQVSA